MKKNKNIEKSILTKQKVISALTENINKTNYLYHTNKVYINNLKRKGDFLSNILDKKISDIFQKLEEGMFTFKYQIYKNENYHPSFLFHRKNDLKKYMIFNEIDNYPYNIFGIRLEFIDTESNRYIYIITIE